MSASTAMSFSDEDCGRLIKALDDALRDLDMYPEHEESLEKAVRSDQLSIDLAKRLLGQDSASNSWKHLMSQSKMPAFLTTPFLRGRPQYSSKLEALLFMAMKLQQNRLEQKRSGNPAESETTQQELAASTPQSPRPANRLELPSFLSEKQKEAIQTCYVHLKNDYDNRRHGMHKRLSILEAALGGDRVESLQQEDTTRPRLAGVNVQTLLEHFARAHSAGPAVAHAAVKGETVATVVSRSLGIAADRGGRIDDVSRVDAAEWTEERKPTMPSQGGKGLKQKGGNNHLAGGHGRKRGNGDSEKKTSPRKKNSNDNNA